MMINAIEKQKNTKKAKKCSAKKLTISLSIRHRPLVIKNIFFTFQSLGGKDATKTW